MRLQRTVVGIRIELQGGDGRAVGGRLVAAKRLGLGHEIQQLGRGGDRRAELRLPPAGSPPSPFAPSAIAAVWPARPGSPWCSFISRTTLPAASAPRWARRKAAICNCKQALDDRRRRLPRVDQHLRSSSPTIFDRNLANARGSCPASSQLKTHCAGASSVRRQAASRPRIAAASSGFTGFRWKATPATALRPSSPARASGRSRSRGRRPPRLDDRPARPIE